ncbi:MAG TPA: TolC family protein [Allosphingosinicella sp.]|nr:TolC family protein [Allosphingosinicella sp.]
MAAAIYPLLLTMAVLPQLAAAQVSPREFPPPTRDPLAIEASEDPILNLARGSVSQAEFLTLIRHAVDRHPQIDEAVAGISEAEAVEDEARAGLFPRVELGINSQRTIARRFEGSAFENIVERSRPLGRTDLSASVEQTIFDWGATGARIQAAGSRLRAASLQAEAAADQTALRAIAAWYDVFAYRALSILGTAFAENQGELRRAVQERIAQGVSAPGDLPRVESYIASSQADLARFRRLLANAEARFEELFGVPPPADLGRAPGVGGPSISKEMAQLLARSAPQVEQAEALARAARQDARAQRAQTLPNVTAGVDAGKFGIEDVDYDVRGRVSVTQRFFGGIEARVDQAEARAGAANARAERVLIESEREAAIAWADVRALEEQLAALESSYLASRQSRDVLAERFRVARGTLFDLLEAESGYFNVAANYIRAVTELDAARYVLLSRTGKLLDTLGIQPPSLERS